MELHKLWFNNSRYIFINYLFDKNIVHQYNIDTETEV